MKVFCFFTALGFSVLTFGAPPLAAEPLNRILANAPFQPSDLEAMRAAERMLLYRSKRLPGGSVEWNNPDTQAYGKVKMRLLSGDLGGSWERSWSKGTEATCLILRHTAVPGGETGRRQFDRKFCDRAFGAWLLSQ